jgi:predicted ATPase/DNA-binding CsgD family transcriptional regulator
MVVIGGTTGPTRTGRTSASPPAHARVIRCREMAQPAARASRGNLPSELTSFVGRRRELAAIRATLSDARLLTLTGAGGVGKTRLALHAGRELSRTLPDGVWLVDLQEVRNASLVPTAVMAVLGLRDQSGQSPVLLLVEYLTDKELLLIFDNCEHLLDSCSVVVSAILHGTPGVRVLATSREPLNTDGEFVYPVPPLALPETDSAASIEQLSQFEAVALFCERASAASGTFDLSSENHMHVIQLCHQLDGMPLAIELAAVRTRALGIEEIVTRLKDRFDLLKAGSRSAVPRHQTLRAAIDWSYDLLTASEQALFRKLAVFAGDFLLEAVEAICTTSPQADEPAIDLLSSLVEKSLVSRVGTDVRARFRLNETMRHYALERLQAAEELDATRSSHLRWYGQLGARADADAFSSRLLPLFDRLDAATSNIRAALHYCVDSTAHLDAGLEFAAALHFWWAARSFTEAISTLQALLGAGEAADRARAKTLFVLGNIYLYANQQRGAELVLDEALPLARSANDGRLMAEILANQALCQIFTGDADALSGQLLEEARRLAAATSDARVLADVDRIDAFRAMQLGDYEATERKMQASINTCREHGDTYILAQNLFWLGLAATKRGDLPAAEKALLEAITLKRCFDDRGTATMISIELLAAPALASGDPIRAARLQGAGAGLRRRQRLELHAIGVPLVTQTAEGIRTLIGDTAYTVEFDTGAAMEHEEAVTYALGERTGVRPEKDRARLKGVVLGTREEEVGLLIAQGLSNKDIAARLFLSVRTVETHVHNVLNKLGVNSRTQIAVWFSEHHPIQR